MANGIEISEAEVSSCWSVTAPRPKPSRPRRPAPPKGGGRASASEHAAPRPSPSGRGASMCFRVAMLSLHTSPLAPLGRTRDAGGMNVYVRELARELGRGGIYVDV